MIKFIYIFAIVLRLLPFLNVTLFLNRVLDRIPFSDGILIEIARKVKENKFQILILCYLSFVVVTNTVSTGAFEVYLNDSLVYSKIQKYRYPTEEVEVNVQM